MKSLNQSERPTARIFLLAGVLVLAATGTFGLSSASKSPTKPVSARQKSRPAPAPTPVSVAMPDNVAEPQSATLGSALLPMVGRIDSLIPAPPPEPEPQDQQAAQMPRPGIRGNLSRHGLDADAGPIEPFRVSIDQVDQAVSDAKTQWDSLKAERQSVAKELDALKAVPEPTPPASSEEIDTARKKVEEAYRQEQKLWVLLQDGAVAANRYREAAADLQAARDRLAQLEEPPSTAIPDQAAIASLSAKLEALDTKIKEAASKAETLQRGRQIAGQSR